MPNIKLQRRAPTVPSAIVGIVCFVALQHHSHDHNQRFAVAFIHRMVTAACADARTIDVTIMHAILVLPCDRTFVCSLERLEYALTKYGLCP